jgi:hypothetical protein
MARATGLAIGLVLFVVLATLNSAGYRYGASDQAFYVPAVIRNLHPDYYPRDAALIDSQARLTIADEAIGAMARVTRLPLPILFSTLYVVALVLLAFAAISLAKIYFTTRLAMITLLAGLTMRHAIAKTGTNSLEGYYHPRQLAFALGAWALVCFLRRRDLWAAILVVAAWLIHPTTALWYAIWLAVAFVVVNRRLVAPALLASAVCAVIAAWALTAGPLAGRLHRMDPEWLATLESKDYLFALDWPLTVWILNLSYPVLIYWLFRKRQVANLVSPRERAVVLGSLSLVAVFAVSLVLNAARLQLAIQLQPARLFWMLDFLATIYVVWALIESGHPSNRRALWATAAICAFTICRGAYVSLIAFPDRPMFAMRFADNDWSRAMAWARQSPTSSHWLADPMHAVLYGTSVRVSGERDVFVEAVKDTAIGMYDRNIAMRTRDRTAELGDFHALTPERAHELAAKYAIDYLVTEEKLDLPVASSFGKLTIYRLR